MFYLQTLKKLFQHISDNGEISANDKAKAKDLINELIKILAMY